MMMTRYQEVSLKRAERNINLGSYFVTETPDCMDKRFTPFKRAVNFVSEISNIDFDSIWKNVRVVIPNVTYNLFFCKDFARMPH